jgi:putative SOS response-associated peptidase YedK
LSQQPIGPFFVPKQEDSMCGRFSLTAPETLADFFDLSDVPDCPPRYNIAPTQPVGVVLFDPEAGHNAFRLMRWGLIPAWAKDASMGSKLINARSETVAEKPSFRAAYKARRCIIPADGFYEWQKVPGGPKQPFRFAIAGGGVFGMAGLWASWQDIQTCTILTTTANELLAPLHDRMPVILAPDDYALWLDPTVRGGDGQRSACGDRLTSLLGPYPAALMNGVPVSKRVNSVKVDDRLCIEPLEG